ncbi:MAG: Lrp/AsnC family transcriptional regulator [Candidatus Margulisiibacteriota bacterium]
MKAEAKKILNAIQEDFPLVERPYLELSKKLKISEKKVLAGIKKMMEDGTIRRFGVLVNHKHLHYFSTLLGVRVSDEMLPQIAKFVAKRSEVTHCYHRGGDFNLWFTFLTPRKAVFDKFFAQVEKKVGKDNILNLPTIKSFKLKTTFKV